VTQLPVLDSSWEATLQWRPTARQAQYFQHLYEVILAGNRQFNLTRITEPEAFWEKHLWDSLRGIAAWLSPQPDQFWYQRPIQRAIDIGSGAGFPGGPVAIAQPSWTVTLLDATRKKVAFLESLIETLGIANLETRLERVEQTGYHQRDFYDLALVRAVAPATVCAEYALPLLQPQGVAVLYRGQWTPSEAIALENAVAKLGGTVAAVEGFVTPLSQSLRHCVYLRKQTATPPEFPRPVGIARQKPL